MANSVETAKLLAQLAAHLTAEFEPQPSHITFVETDHEITSRAIIPLSVIQED